MKIRELFEYVDEVMENVFSDKVKLRWLNQIEAELQTDVLLLAADGVVQYTEDDMDAVLIAPPPFDEIYTEYLQYRICLAQEEPERANNKAATYNRIFTAYQIYVAGTVDPGNGMAERMRYYLSAYQIAVKRGYTGSESEWLAGLHGRDGKDGTGVTMEFNEETGMLEITVTGSADEAGGVVFILDTTLTVEGAAADAKAVGDALAEIKSLAGSGTGDAAANGVGVASVEQTVTSTEDGGVNEWTMTLTDGTTAVLQVRNGSMGETGEKGISVVDIGYDAQSGKWYWDANDELFTRTYFTGPDVYNKDEIDALFGSYITDVASLVGGDA